MIRMIWIGVGGTALSLGVVGLFLPLLPTVPFLLLSAFCFARSSARLHSWLLNHPRLGPPITDWNERGAIGRRAKWLGLASCLGSFGLAVLIGIPPKILLLQGLTLAGVCVFIWTRPDR